MQALGRGETDMYSDLYILRCFPEHFDWELVLTEPTIHTPRNLSTVLLPVPASLGNTDSVQQKSGIAAPPLCNADNVVPVLRNSKFRAHVTCKNPSKTCCHFDASKTLFQTSATKAPKAAPSSLHYTLWAAYDQPEDSFHCKVAL